MLPMQTTRRLRHRTASVRHRLGSGESITRPPLAPADISRINMMAMSVDRPRRADVGIPWRERKASSGQTTERPASINSREDVSRSGGTNEIQRTL